MAPTICCSSMAMALYATVIVLVHAIFASSYVVHQSGGSLISKSANLTNRTHGSWVNCQGCGLTLDARIVGGQEADIDDFLWTVDIRANGKHICGGSVIRNRYVLTAAHCVADHAASMYTVHASITDLHQYTGFVSEVESGTYHPQYNSYTNDYDVAVLRLAKPLPVGTHVQTVCLPSTRGIDAESVGQYATVCGWGVLRECHGEECHFVTPTHLHKVEVPIVSNAVCRAARGHLQSRLTITDQMLCAGYLEGCKDSCNGDSGGPLVWNSNGVWTQVGIVSHGVGCARPDCYGIYSRVSALMSFIAQNTAGPNEC